MSEWQSATLVGNGIQIHYTRTGGNKPPFVLAHGFSDDGLCWTPVAERLAVDYDVIMPDARGHGRSDAPEEGYGDAYFAADLAALIQGLGLDHPPILGHSMGAATAMALAGLYPDIPGAILLSDPPVRWPTTPVTVEPDGDTDEDSGEEAAEEIDWLAQTRAWITGLQSKTREELIVEERANSGWSDAELGPWADAKLRLSLNVIGRRGSPEPEWPAILPQITCPVDHSRSRTRLVGLCRSRHRFEDTDTPAADRTHRRRRSQHPPRAVRPVYGCGERISWWSQVMVV